MVSILDSESSDPSSNRGGTYNIFFCKHWAVILHFTQSERKTDFEKKACYIISLGSLASKAAFH